MKKMMKMFMVAMAAVAVPALTAVAANNTDVPDAQNTLPGEINFQGLLREPKTGALYTNGIYHLEFRIFNNSTGSGVKPLWGDIYSVYVRDGYFNVMLGTKGSGESTMAKYTGTSLWKALWYNTNNKELWLQITPWENSKNQDTGTHKAITPMQKLLPTPFAHRALSSVYAQESRGAFTVGSDLTVNGKLTVRGGSSGLNLQHITTGPDVLALGTDTSSPGTSTLQGNKVYVKAASGIEVTPGGNHKLSLSTNAKSEVSGGIHNFTPSGDFSVALQKGNAARFTGGDFEATGGKFTAGKGLFSILSATSKVSIKGGEVDILSEGSGQKINLQAPGRISVKSTGNAVKLASQDTVVSLSGEDKKIELNTYTGTMGIAVATLTMDGSTSDITVRSTDGDVKLNGRKVLLDGNEVNGKGSLKWSGSNGTFRSPFLIYNIEVKTSTPKSNGKLAITSALVGDNPVNDYNWVVVGTRPKDDADYDSNAMIVVENGNSVIYAHGYDNKTMIVQVMGILKNMSTDGRQ